MAIWQKLLSLLIGSLLVFALAAYATFDIYRSKKLQRLSVCPEPLKFARVTQTDGGASTAISENAERRLYFIGDSRMWAWAKQWRNPSFDVVNLGVPGETTPELRCRFSAAFHVEPDAFIVLSAGINDLVAASLARSDQERRQIEQNAVNNIITLAHELKAHSDNIIIMNLIPPIKPDLIRSIAWGGGLESATLEFNRTLVHGVDGDVAILDAVELFTDKQTHRWNAKYAKDALHWNTVAYDELSQTLLDMVNN